ncbi:MAG: hypothetical protein HXY50_04605 [Ignavibacteriaceae bacterium]|nr:hypothetical protein [Ignavibacteriaceae bacterium]
MKSNLITLFLLGFMLLTPVNAQFNLYSDYQGIYDDNIFNNNQKVSDFINNFSFGAAYNFESELNNVQLYYEGSMNSFREISSKSFNTHRIGFVETYLFSEDTNPLNVGLNYSRRNNRDEFEVFNFEQISAYANYRHSVSETDFILPGYIFNWNSYPNFTLFSHNEHKFFLTWSSSFQTKTSLSLNAELNYKQYLEQYDFEGYLNSASQLKFHINLGQSLGENTGINGFALIRKNLTDGSRYLVSDSLIYYEEEIFNDIYAYDGFEAGFGIRHYLTENIELSLESKYSLRQYSSLPAADIYGNELSSLRLDKLLGVGAGISIDMNSIINGLSFYAAWNYFKNTSNDYYYKYTNQIISASLNYGF